MDERDAPAQRPAESDCGDENSPKHSALIPEYQREAMVQRLESEGAEDLASHLRNCGKELPLTCTCCGAGKKTFLRCRKRWCPVCAPIVARERLRRWKTAVEQIQWPLFLTLTMPNSADPECVRELRKSWGKFRRRKLIRERVVGGVGAVEVTNIGNGFHPHLHAIVDSRWLALYTREPSRKDPPEVVKELCESAQRELSGAWSQQLKTSRAIVHVCRVRGDQATVYALKYATKAAELLSMPGEISPLLRVLRRSRLVSGFGSLFPLPAVDEEQRPGVACESCGAESNFLPDSVILASICKNQSHAATIGRSVPPSKQLTR